MYEELYEPIPQTKPYLKRLGLTAVPAADKENLDRLIYAHQLHVPFEDLDVCEFKRTASLSISSLYEKIVLKKRGGYCYELNALFASLLTACGYEVTPCMARIIRDCDDEFIAPISHRINLVRIDGQQHFCDVGYGGPMPAASMPLVDGLEECIKGQTFRLDQTDAFWWKLSYCSKDTFSTVMSFSPVPCEPVDFVALNAFASTHEHSVFPRLRMVNLRTPGGSVSLMGDIFTCSENGEKTVRQITEEEFLPVLEQYFHLHIS